jgi:hypothetical protein
LTTEPRAAITPPGQPARWFAGDLHQHVSPPDTESSVKLSVTEVSAAATRARMDFVILTPHLWTSTWRDDRDRWQRAWRSFAGAARSLEGPTMIPGVEWTTPVGHFTVVGSDASRIGDSDFLTASHAAGAFISVNHPFAVPTNIPGVGASHYDMSYRVWSNRQPGFTSIAGAEVWNVPLGLANLVSRPGGKTGEERAWTELDRIVREEKRPITAVGGTDDHRGNVMPTTWVLAPDPSEPSILAGLRAGARCIGGAEAGTMRARGDGEPVGIGGVVTGNEIRLTWDGTARLYIDGVDRGEHAGGFVHDSGGALHTYRIQIGISRCNFIYANL